MFSGSKKFSLRVWSMFFQNRSGQETLKKFKFGFCRDFGLMRFEAVVVKCVKWER